MNKVRNMSAIRRNISHREDELKRIQEMLVAGEPSVVAFRKKWEIHMAELSNQLGVLKKELSELEGDADHPHSE